MALPAADRRRLLAQSHQLAPVATIKDGPPPESVLAHLRTCFATRELLKVRVHADDAVACDRVAAALTGGVPCELVRRVGHVLVLYRAAPAERQAGAEGDGVGGVNFQSL